MILLITSPSLCWAHTFLETIFISSSYASKFTYLNKRYYFYWKGTLYFKKQKLVNEAARIN